jgi:hypothetical protein
MGVKVYISLMSGNKEVKKRQQKILMILDSKNIKYDVVDITEPGKEEDKEFMQANSTFNGSTASDPEPRHPLPPQLFNDSEYCGDFEQFDLANEIDNLEVFLKLSPEESSQIKKSTIDASKIKPKEATENGEGKKNGEEAEEDENKENKTEEGANIEEEIGDENDKIENLSDGEQFGDGIQETGDVVEETVTGENANGVNDVIKEEEEGEVDGEEEELDDVNEQEQVKEENQEVESTEKPLTESEKMILAEQANS